MSRSEHHWRERSSKGPPVLTPPRPSTGEFSPVDSADAKPPSQILGSAKMDSLCKIRPGVLGDIRLQTIWSLWDPPTRAHFPTTQPYLTLWDPMDCSLTGFSVHGILQVRILWWVLFSSPGDLTNPGIELGSPAFQADSLPSEQPGKPSVSKRQPNIPESIV